MIKFVEKRTISANTGEFIKEIVRISPPAPEAPHAPDASHNRKSEKHTRESAPRSWCAFPSALQRRGVAPLLTFTRIYEY